jgi:hypothetical protein
MGASWQTWRRILRNSQGIDPKYRGRGRFVTTSILGLTPLRMLEAMRYGPSIRRTTIDADPVFVLGHWRSGTTHLHNVLTQDPQFGYVTTFQTIAPEFFLSGKYLMGPLYKMLMPKERPMDNVALELHGPQEEEIAMAQVSACAFYHGLYFPQQMDEFFRRYVLFEGMTSEEYAEWCAAYVRTLKKATISCKGRRLVIKNPANTGRIKQLLELFPNAKFIHVYRNPYVVLPSTMRFYSKILEMTALQDIDKEQLERHILDFYRILMERYFEDQSLIPEGQLSEVRFENFEIDPHGELERIYTELDLPGLDEAQQHVATYLDGQKSYEKNVHKLDPNTIQAVEQHWRFALDKWAYHAPDAV